MYHVKPVIALKFFPIATHTYTASFSKCILIKLTTFFNSKTKAIYLNLWIVYESKLKIGVTSTWTFSKLCLCQQLFTNKDFCMKIKVCYYLITTSAMRSPKPFQEAHAEFKHPKTSHLFLPGVQYVTSLNV